MKRIVVLALHLGTGGIENVIASMSNILTENYKVKIISTYKVNEIPAFKLNNNIEIEYLLNCGPNKKELLKAIKYKKIVNIFKQGVKSLKILFLKRYLMIKAIKNIDAEFVISTRIIHNKWLGKYGNKKTIKIAQEHNYHNNNNKYIRKVVKSVKNIDYFMPTSKELCEFYKTRLINKKTKVVYIQNSLERFSDKVSNLKSKNILSIGRLSSEKGYVDLIEIYKMVSKIHDDWKLRIVGDGLQREELENKIKELKLEEKVILTGFKNKDELDEIFMDSSIYVMTSYTESFGLVLIEAENYGIPLLVFDTARGALEIVEDGKNGFFVKNRSKKEMANKINKLIENYNLRCKIGAQGRICSETFKKEIVAEKWYKFIESAKKQI